MVKIQYHFRMEQYVKIAYIAERRVFFLPIFCCPTMAITPTFLTSTGFMMTHFEAKKHGKTIESPKSNIVKGQMSAML